MHRCVCMRMCVHTQYMCSFGFASEVNESMQKCSLWFGWGKTCRGGFIELGGGEVRVQSDGLWQNQTRPLNQPFA